MRVKLAVFLAFASLTLNAVADIPEAARPSSSLRVQLRDAQTAIEREDRRAFADALARVRTTLAEYPPGGEKTAAQNVLGVYEDVAVLWDAQFQSPFFAEDSAAYRAANGYPGWTEGVRRNILVDDRDRRFYPARESRQYLAGIAVTRLQRLGVSTVDDEPRTALPSVRPRRRPGKVETHTPEVTPKRSPSPSSRTSTAKAVSRPPVAAPATPPPPPVMTQIPTETTAPPPPPVDTAPISVPDTAFTSSSPTETTATEAIPAAEPEKRNLIIPIILILVGIGVLIVLFRTST